jgi:chitin disaccharide deacetylase
MKYLIVNGDDFGASRGINRGILEAHCRGILTSASLMVDTPFSAEAARLRRDYPQLSVGLHVHLPGRGREMPPDLEDPEACDAELRRQFSRFAELLGWPPTYLDSHHDVHRVAWLLPSFLRVAREHGLPLRGYAPVRCFSQFYGQWDGVSHPEQVSVPSLVRMLRTQIPEGCTELTCHPGYADPDFRTSYSGEREAELQTLCDPRVRDVLSEQQIQLIGFRDLSSLRTSFPA